MTTDELAALLEAREIEGSVTAGIAEMEQALGVTLPHDYQGFLESTNGGSASAKIIFHIRDSASAGPVEREVIEFFGFPKSGPSLPSLHWVYQISEQRLPADLLCIARDSCGDPICIRIKGASPGSVWIIDHEGEAELMDDAADGRWESSEHATKVAASFGEFVGGVSTGEKSVSS